MSVELRLPPIQIQEYHADTRGYVSDPFDTGENGILAHLQQRGKRVEKVWKGKHRVDRMAATSPHTIGDLQHDVLWVVKNEPETQVMGGLVDPFYDTEFSKDLMDYVGETRAEPGNDDLWFYMAYGMDFGYKAHKKNGDSFAQRGLMSIPTIHIHQVKPFHNTPPDGILEIRPDTLIEYGFALNIGGRYVLERIDHILQQRFGPVIEYIQPARANLGVDHIDNHPEWIGKMADGNYGISRMLYVVDSFEEAGRKFLETIDELGGEDWWIDIVRKIAPVTVRYRSYASNALFSSVPGFGLIFPGTRDLQGIDRKKIDKRAVIDLFTTTGPQVLLANKLSIVRRNNNKDSP